MGTIGHRELRQQASDVLRRVEGGEEITVTVAGRPSAKLVPAADFSWRTWADYSAVFDGPADDDWDRDRDEVPHDVVDPWDRA